MSKKVKEDKKTKKIQKQESAEAVSDPRPKRSPKFRMLGRKTKIIIGTIVLLVIAGGGLAVWFIHKSTKSTESEDQAPKVVCDKKTVDRYIELDAPIDNADELAQVEIDSIMEKDGYIEDPTCLYVLAQYYSMIKSYPQAMQFTDLLEERLNEGQELSSSLIDPYTPQELRQYFEFRILTE